MTEPGLATTTAPGAAALSTTFGGSAAELVPAAATGKRWLIPAVAAVVLVGAVAAYFVFLRPARTTPAAKPPTASLAPPSPSPSPAATVTPPSPPAVSPRVQLKVDSKPPGADVYRVSDGVLLGTTPHVEELPRGRGQAVFMLKLAGHQDARVVLSIAEDADFVQPMTPLEKTSSRKSTGSKTRKGDKKPAGQVEVKDGTFDPFK